MDVCCLKKKSFLLGVTKNPLSENATVSSCLQFENQQMFVTFTYSFVAQRKNTIGAYLYISRCPAEGGRHQTSVLSIQFLGSFLREQVKLFRPFCSSGSCL